MSPTASAGNARLTQRFLLIWIVVGFALTFCGAYFRQRMYSQNPDAFRTFIDEWTGYLSILPSIGILMLIHRHFPISNGRWPLRILGYCLLTLPLGALHTTLMNLSRSVLYPMIEGMGHYHMGDPLSRYLYEFSKEFLAFWFLLGLLEGINLYRSQQQQKIDALELEQRWQQSQLALLKQQLNPHFLFNTLNLISVSAYENPAFADRIIGKLSDLLRMSLDFGKTEWIPLRRELEFLDAYMEIMAARFEGRIQSHTAIPENLMDYLVPSLILQPLAENAVKHGMDASNQAIECNLFAHIDPKTNQLCLSYENSVLDGPPNEGKTSTGMGLNHLQERLKLLLKTPFTLHSGLENGTFRVRICLPANTSIPS
jgi:hypothetical protein